MSETVIDLDVEQEVKREITAANGRNGSGPAEPRSTVLAVGDNLHGRLAMKGNGEVLGNFQGEIECEGELRIGREAEVAADIRAKNIVIEGHVRGDVTASGKMKLASTGRLDGDARVGALVVQEGGVHHGAIRVHPEGLPSEPEPEPEPVAAAPEPERAPALRASVDRVKNLWGELF